MMRLPLMTSLRMNCASSASPKLRLPTKSYEAVRESRKFLFPLYNHHYYKEPFMPSSGFKEYIYDHKGREYLDLVGGISCVNVGHCHPRLTKIFENEAGKLATLPSYYTSEHQALYAEQLCKELGNDLDSVFFFNSGSEANDFAYNLAKVYSKSQTVVALRNGYHGTAGNAYSLTSIGTWNSPLARSLDLERLAWPNLYRSAHISVDSLIKDAQEQLDSNTNGRIAGFWAEPIMGAGGINPLGPEYAQKIYKLVKKYHGLYISDEVQTGFGRVGQETWGFKWLGVKPDMVIMAKAIGNGFPFAAVVTRRQIGDAMKFEHYAPYAGGPLQCRLGMEVLNILRDEKLPEHAEKIGNYLKSEFKRIQSKSPYIGDVRGKGMMLGVEFVKNKQTKEIGLEQMSHVMEQCRMNGVLFGKGGFKGNLVRVLGPLCLSMKNAQKAIDVFEKAVMSIPAV